MTTQRGRRIRLAAAITATAALVGTAGWFWFDSLVPSTYSIMDMGYVDGGGGPVSGHVHGRGGTAGASVATLTGPRDGAPACPSAYSPADYGDTG